MIVLLGFGQVYGSWEVDWKWEMLTDNVIQIQRALERFQFRRAENQKLNLNASLRQKIGFVSARKKCIATKPCIHYPLIHPLSTDTSTIHWYVHYPLIHPLNRNKISKSAGYIVDNSRKKIRKMFLIFPVSLNSTSNKKFMLIHV